MHILVPSDSHRFHSYVVDSVNQLEMEERAKVLAEKEMERETSSKDLMDKSISMPRKQVESKTSTGKSLKSWFSLR